MGACCTTRDENTYAKEEKEKAGLTKDNRNSHLSRIDEQTEEPDSFDSKGDFSKQKQSPKKE